MTHQSDSSPCTALPIPPHDRIISIGWLDADHPFETGKIDRRVFDQLIELLKSPWQPFVFMGIHECSLCQFTGEAKGKSNLFVPANNRIYVAPELIAHYINAHHYKPTDEFCDAILSCPPMRSQQYRAALSKTGLLKVLQNPIGQPMDEFTSRPESGPLREQEGDDGD
ncbi:MAG: hypothetical protein H6818_04720 [Phycisphaerales bacterium]|nr:hypothetical protein [Phycisphaerales bacterium]